MAVSNIRRGGAPAQTGRPNANSIRVDNTNDVLVFGTGASGTSEKTAVDLSSTQTITGDKTFTGTVVISGVSTKTEFADGTVALPSITFSDDLDSGVYRIGANNVGLAVNAAKVLDISTTGLGVTGTLTATQGINFNGLNPTASPISFEGITLTNNTNAIRGASVNPTRTSGWISFSGTISTSPSNCYTDYRELHTTGTAQVLGAGFFPYMDSGASCNSMFAVQAIAFVSSGSTVTTAAGAQGTGVYALYGKTTIDSATVNSGAQIAAAWLSVQANVTDISGRASALVHGEVASGALRDLFYFNATGGVLATNLFNFSASTAPIVAGGAGSATVASGNWLQVRVVVDGTAYYFPICSALWTNV